MNLDLELMREINQFIKCIFYIGSFKINFILKLVFLLFKI